MQPFSQAYKLDYIFLMQCIVLLKIDITHITITKLKIIVRHKKQQNGQKLQIV